MSGVSRIAATSMDRGVIIVMFILGSQRQLGSASGNDQC
jgi:hypothetical protein